MKAFHPLAFVAPLAVLVVLAYFVAGPASRDGEREDALGTIAEAHRSQPPLEPSSVTSRAASEVPAKPSGAEAPRIRGICVAAEDQRPLPGAEIRARIVANEGAELAGRSDETGHFEVLLDPAPAAGQQVMLAIESAGRGSYRRLLQPFAPGEARDLGAITFALGQGLSGRVTSTMGEPIAGAAVVVGGAGASTEAAATDAEGRFVIRGGLAPGRYEVIAQAQGYVVARRSIDVPLADELVIELASVQSIRGMALDEADQPIAGVEVHADLAQLSRSGVTDAEGRFEIFDPIANAELTELHVRPGITESFRSGWTVAWGARDVVVRLKRAVAFELEVVDQQSGAPVEAYAVHLMPAAHRGRPSQSSLRFAGRHERGLLRVAPAERGEWVLWVVPSEATHAPCERMPLNVTGDPELKFRVELERRADLHFEVVDAGGLSVAGTRVELVRAPLGRELHRLDEAEVDGGGLLRSEFYRAALLDSALSDVRGRAVLRGVPRRPQLVPISYKLGPEVYPAIHVRAAAEGGGRAQLVAPESTSAGAPFRIVLEASGRLVGRVEPLVVVPLKPMLSLAPPITVIQLGFPDLQTPQRLFGVDERGSFACEDLGAGEYELRISLPGMGRPKRLQRFTITAGATSEIVVDLGAFAPALVRVRVQGAPASQKVAFQLEEPSGSSASHRTASMVDLDTEGRTREIALAPGTYDVLLIGEGLTQHRFDSFQFTAGEQREIDLEYRPRRLSVIVHKPDGSPWKPDASEMAHEGAARHSPKIEERVLVFDPGPTSAFFLVLGNQRYPPEGRYKPPEGTEPWELEVTLRR